MERKEHQMYTKKFLTLGCRDRTRTRNLRAMNPAISLLIYSAIEGCTAASPVLEVFTNENQYHRLLCTNPYYHFTTEEYAKP